MTLRQRWQNRGSEVTWTLAYALYLLMTISLIIVSTITNKYGGTVFGATQGATAGTGTSNGNEEGAQEGALSPIERDHAIARSGVVSSIGTAIGSVALITTLLAFCAFKYLDYCWDAKNPRKVFDQRFIVVAGVSFLNIILGCGDIALTVGYALTSRSVMRHTLAQSTSTPGYLIGAAVMAALTGIMAFVTVSQDVSILKLLGKDVASDEEERVPEPSS